MKRILFPALAFLALSCTLGAAAPGYRVEGKIPLPGEERWDYLTADAQARRLYVSRGTHVVVLDLDTGKVVGDIPDTPGVHGIALAPSLGRGFVSCGRSDTAVIFDLKSLAVLGTVKTGGNPDSILFDPASKLVFTFDGSGKDATAFEPLTGKVVATLPLGGKPEAAATDARGRLYINIEDTSEVVEVDTAKLALLRRFPLAPGQEPSGMAFDAARGLVYSGCSNRVMTVLEVKSGKVVAAVPIGDGVDGNAFDPETGLVFSANGEGTLTVARETAPGKFEVLETVPTQKGARTLTLDAKTHRVYLPTAQFGPAPAPTPDNPRGRPPVLKDSFVLLVVGRP